MLEQVLFALVFWNMLWGIPGALLSIPIVSAVKIVLINLQHPGACAVSLARVAVQRALENYCAAQPLAGQQQCSRVTSI